MRCVQTNACFRLAACSDHPTSSGRPANWFNGVIGTVNKADVAVGGPPRPCDLPGEPDEPGLDWSFWLGPAPMRPYNSILSPRGVHKGFPNWRNYQEYAAGMVGDWGAHH